MTKAQINLPKTAFSMKANLPTREPEILEYWKKINLYDEIRNDDKYLKGIANLGYRPTFNQKKILLEVHLFNFSGNLYNKLLTVEFLKFIRKEKKFKNVNQLKAQIKKDLNIAKNTK